MTVSRPAARPLPNDRRRWGTQGAHWDGETTLFSLWAPDAERVELCLLDTAGREQRVPMTALHGEIWTCRIEGAGPGQRYGWRVHGPWEPHLGRRYNQAKLLLDPYALAIDGSLVLNDAIFGHRATADDTVRDDRDSAPFVPLSVVVDERFDWEDVQSPLVPWSETVIYETHVKGLTWRHPAVPPRLRGTYAGLAHPAVVEHLLGLGVTTVELLPVHHFVSETSLLRRGLRNYWGYNSVGFFAPHGAYSASGSRGGQVSEFKAMVKALHEAGLEVVLDVVYNHTGEGDERGPTLSFRGIANGTYYRLRHGHRYADVTGCGNTMDLRDPQTLQLVLDSLRYWAQDMHVDGFRFDLAPALTRDHESVDQRSTFLAALRQDPVLRGRKIIAEPWDVGSGGYQLGAFRRPWAEWNDKYRDDVRDFWLGSVHRGHGVGVRAIATRLSGSSDVFAGSRRGPEASINFVTAHDGFTLRDLVTYQRKRNEANGEDNRDGADDNRNWNCGEEGETSNRDVNALRHRQMRNLLATLLLSTGTPMLLAGDEIGRTQAGNNNAYCIDDDTTWVDWDLEPWQRDLLAFTRALLSLRRQHPVFRQVAFFDGRPVQESGVKDVAWFGRDGTEMTDGGWFDSGQRTLSCYMWGGVVDVGPTGGRSGIVSDDSFLVVLHAGTRAERVVLPGQPWAGAWRLVLDTMLERPKAGRRDLPAGSSVQREAWSVAVYLALDELTGT